MIKDKQDTLRSDTIVGVSWSVASQVIIQISSFIIGIVMVRLLTPKDFGMMSMVLVITGFANVFKNFGLGSAIIQDQTLKQEDLSTIFWFNISLGAIVSFIIYSSSGFIADFYDTPKLADITAILSINFFITSLNLVQFSLFKKRLDFKTIFIVQTTATILSGVIGISLAMFDYGVWSLVVKALIFSSVGCLLFWTFSRWTPSFTFNTKSLKKVFNFSIPLLSSEAFNYWVRNIDNLLIGKYLGGQQLGFYDRSYQLMLLPVSNISSVIGNVLFPSFSKIAEEHERIGNIFRLSVGSICLIVMPLMIGLFLTADHVVLVVFGEAWLEMIPVLKVLSLLGVSQSVIHLTSSIMLSQGATKLIFKLGLLTKIFTILMIVFGLQYGIVGVAVCYFIANLFTSPLIFYVSGRLINLPYFKVLKSIVPIIISTMIMGFFVYAVGQWLSINEYQAVIILLAQVITGGLIYVAAIFYLKPESFIYLQSIYQNRIQNN